MRFRCPLCKRLKRRGSKHGGDASICLSCLRKVDALVLREEAASGYTGPHVFAGGIACVRIEKVREKSGTASGTTAER